MRALAFVILLCGCADSAPTEFFELAGYVLDIDTDAPIEGARVTFRSDTRYTASGTSDDDGRYAISVETDTPFGQVRAEKDGYSPGEETVFFDSPERRVDLRMRNLGR